MEQLSSPQTGTERASKIIPIFPPTSKVHFAWLRALPAAVLGRACQPCTTAVGARLTPRKVYRGVRISHRAAQRHAKTHPKGLGGTRIARRLSTDDSQLFLLVSEV